MTDVSFKRDDFSRYLLVSTCVNCEGKGYEWKKKTGYVSEVLGMGAAHGWQACWMCDGYGTTFSEEHVRALLGHKHKDLPK